MVFLQILLKGRFYFLTFLKFSKKRSIEFFKIEEKNHYTRIIFYANF
jgi:hypothetical protein